MDNTILYPVPLHDFLGQVRQIIREEIQAEKDKQMEKLLTTEEARKVFQPELSKSTLILWTKNGVIPCHRIGGRVYYKLSELLNRAKTLKKYKK